MANLWHPVYCGRCDQRVKGKLEASIGEVHPDDFVTVQFLKSRVRCPHCGQIAYSEAIRNRNIVSCRRALEDYAQLELYKAEE